MSYFIHAMIQLYIYCKFGYNTWVTVNTLDLDEFEQLVAIRTNERLGDTEWKKNIKKWIPVWQCRVVAQNWARVQRWVSVAKIRNNSVHVDNGRKNNKLVGKRMHRLRFIEPRTKRVDKNKDNFTSYSFSIFCRPHWLALPRDRLIAFSI